MSELKKFQAEYAALAAKVSTVDLEHQNCDKSSGELRMLNVEFIAAIAKRVELLKGKGDAGTKIGDFLKDAEVKKSYDAVQGNVATLKKLHERQLANIAVAVKTKKSFDDLKKRLEKEAAARKNKIIGKESVSAPEMEKLAQQIVKFCKEKGQAVESLDVLVLKKPTFVDGAAKQIEDAVSKSKTKAAALEQDEKRDVLHRSLDVRLLKGSANKIKTLYDLVFNHCTMAMKAIQVGGAEKAKGILGQATSGLGQMATIATETSTAYQQNKSNVEASTDAKAVTDLVNFIVGTHKRAVQTVEPVRQKIG